MLKHLGKHHTLNVTTNFSFDAGKLIKEVGPMADKAALVISASFHPEYNNIEDFISKVRCLKAGGIYTSVSMVAWPPSLKEIPKIKALMEENEIQFLLIPLGGNFLGKEYPDGYTQEERDYLKKLSLVVSNKASKDMYDFKVEGNDKKRPSKLCRNGMNFGMIRPNCDVFRCCTFEKDAYLGNIIDGSFRFLEEPRPCSIASCNCYKAMLVGDEEKCFKDWNWAKHKEGLYYEATEKI